MNDIARKATADKFLKALEKETLSKKEAGASIGFTAVQVSYLFNEKYWSRLGTTYWDKLLAWVNSGQSLKEYAEKHGKVLPPEKTVDEKEKIKEIKITPENKEKIESAIRLSKHPYFSGVPEEVQKIRIDIEINLIINGKKIKL